MLILNEFLPNNVADDLLNLVLKIPSNTFHDSNDTWQKSLVRPGSTVKVHMLPAAIRFMLLSLFQVHGIIPQNFSGSFEAAANIWRPYSYIPWHDDHSYSGGATIYLNQSWDLDWGGLLLYKDPKTSELHVVPPRFNTVAVNSTKCQHATTIVSPDAPPRITIQCFWGERTV